MLEMLHRIGSRVRNSRWLRQQKWVWNAVEPVWQKTFARLTRESGYLTRVNGDLFRLDYEYGSRYDREGKQEYEPLLYHAVMRELRQGMCVLDIGAHIGMFTLGAALRLGKTGRVFAFEPAPETARIVERQVRLNRWQDRIEVVRAVVSDREGTVPFYVLGATMSASLGRENVDVLSPEKHDQPAQEIHVPSVTLDSFCRTKDIQPQVIKIDVEGAELLILRGARNLLRSTTPRIFCEVHPDQMRYCGSSLAEFEAFVESIDYSSERLDEPNTMGIYHVLLVRRGGKRSAPSEEHAAVA